MSIDPRFIVQNATVLLGLYALCWIFARFGRQLLGWSAIVLFCVGEYGWAFLLFCVWCIAEREHRRDMALDRAAGLYDGPWID